MLKFTKISTQVTQCLTGRSISCSSARCIDQRWRESKGLPANPNEFGPLTNLPDYTFVDGRPTPMGSRQMKRLKKQQEVAEKIVQYSKELSFAKERHANLKAAEAAQKDKILNDKLKPKGHLLLKKN